MAKHTTRNHKFSLHRTLSLFLYDLSSAGRLLPSAAVLPEQFHGSSVDTGSEMTSENHSTLRIDSRVGFIVKLPVGVGPCH
jgi:hypothetical protein